jgi:NTP pyrophosphatase (non-canonical NTP hydrolase)
MNRTEILQEAIKKYGVQSQCDMCIEEMSELTKALLKLRRASTQPEMQKCRENIREEIADVQIMIDQMRMVYGDTAEQEKYKIQRLRKRMVL